PIAAKSPQADGKPKPDKKAEKPKPKAKARAKVLALPAPKATPKQKSKLRSQPRPDARQRRPATRGLKSKLIIAATLTTVLLVFHDRLPRILAVPGETGITTGAISVQTPNAHPALAETAEIKAFDDKAIENVALSGDGHVIVAAANG